MSAEASHGLTTFNLQPSDAELFHQVAADFDPSIPVTLADAPDDRVHVAFESDQPQRMALMLKFAESVIEQAAQK